MVLRWPHCDPGGTSEYDSTAWAASSTLPTASSAQARVALDHVPPAVVQCSRQAFVAEFDALVETERAVQPHHVRKVRTGLLARSEGGVGQLPCRSVVSPGDLDVAKNGPDSRLDVQCPDHEVAGMFRSDLQCLVDRFRCTSEISLGGEHPSQLGLRHPEIAWLEVDRTPEDVYGQLGLPTIACRFDTHGGCADCHIEPIAFKGPGDGRTEVLVFPTGADDPVEVVPPGEGHVVGVIREVVEVPVASRDRLTTVDKPGQREQPDRLEEPVANGTGDVTSHVDEGLGGQRVDEVPSLMLRHLADDGDIGRSEAPLEH